MDSSPAPKRLRLRRFLRVGAGWLLVGLFVLLLVTVPTPKSSGAPAIHCGKPAIVLMFVKNAADVPASQREECHHDAGSQVLGGLFLFALPGTALLLWKRLHFRVPSRAVRPPRRPSRFGPKPVEATFTSHLDVATATERLRVLGNGGPPGSLRVRFGEPGAVDARLVSQGTPRFFGSLTATPDGSQLRGATRPAPEQTRQVAFFVLIAVIAAIAGLAMVLAGAPSGRIDLGFLWAVAFGAFFGALAYGFRRLADVAFPRTVNVLHAALASALETTPPLLPVQPGAARDTRIFFAGLFMLQFVLVGGRVAVDGGVVAGVVTAAIFAVVVLFAFRASLWWKPRLRGTELQAGFRRLDLTQVNDVRARAAFMSLSDGRTRIVVSSALGRPESLHAAELALTSPDTPADQLDDVRLFQAVGDVVSRCPLDEQTAAVLHRPATMPGVSRPGPRVDPSALAPVLIMFGGFALAFVLVAAWR